MNLAPDTNVLVRVFIDDVAEQNAAARQALAQADAIVLSIVVLCEAAWVLSSRYRLGKAEIADAFRRLSAIDSVVVDRAALDAGLSLLDAGGDFADGVIGVDATRLGADRLVTFDRQAVRLLHAQGVSVELLPA